MAISDAAVPTAQATTNGSAEDNDAQLIGKLAKLWADDNKRGLKVRLKTGNLLNAHLGPPTERQRRGQSVLKQAAERLNIAESEINRMRWFAHFSSDEKSCWGETPPGKRTWTLFKERLPNLIAAEKDNEKPTACEGDDKLAVQEGNEKHQRSSGEKKKTAVVDGLSEVD